MADVADPVMVADANLDFRVSAAEFHALAERRFVSLAGPGGDRAVGRAAVAATCPRPAPR